MPNALNNSKITYTQPKNGYFYHIPFDQIERIEYCPMSGTSGETVTSAAKRIKWNNRYPDIIVNAELFTSSYSPASGVVDEGESLKLTETFGIAFQNKKTPVFSYKNNVNATDWIGAYPTLVKDGQLGFTSIPSGLSGNRARTALGIKNNNTFGILVIPEQSGTNDATLNNIAEIFMDAGYSYAINLDGGGSTSYQTNDVSYEQGRRVRGFICVWYKGGQGNLASRKVSTSTTAIIINSSTNTSTSLPYQVRITASKLRVRGGPSVLYRIKTMVSKNEIYTITEVKNGWGKLKSGVGWICLQYTQKI